MYRIKLNEGLTAVAINKILPANCGPVASGVNMGKSTVKS